MNKKSFSKQLPINLLTNILVFVISTLIGLFITPFFIKYIGLDGLGMIKLASTIPVYIGLLTVVISGAVSRFLSIDLNQNNILEANKTFNTAFFSLSSLLLVLVPFIFIFSYNISYFFKIPLYLQNESIYLFIGILLASLISIFSSLFMIPAFANNRLDVTNLTRLATRLLQTILIVTLLIYFSTSLISVGIAYLAGALLGLIVSLNIWKKFAPKLIISIKFFDFKKLKELSTMGQWLVLDQIGTILFLYIDLLVVNYVFGSEATGEYAIPLQWQTMLRSLANVLAGVITPMILISYAKAQHQKIIDFSYFSVKFLGMALAIPIGLIAGFAPSLLKIWVGEEFIYLVPLLWLIILPMAINLSFSALYPIATAYNKIKTPAYVTLFTGVFSLLLALFFTMYLDFGLYGVALAGVIAFTGRNLLFTVYYTAYLTGSKSTKYYKSCLFGVIVTILTFIGSYLLQQYINIESWFSLLGLMFIVTINILFIIWFFMLTPSEREIILKILNIKQKEKKSE